MHGVLWAGRHIANGEIPVHESWDYLLVEQEAKATDDSVRSGGAQTDRGAHERKRPDTFLRTLNTIESALQRLERYLKFLERYLKRRREKQRPPGTRGGP